MEEPERRADQSRHRRGTTTTTLARLHTNPITDLLNWLESESGLGLRPSELQSYIRIEDHVDDGTYVLRAEMPGIDPDKDVTITVDHGTLTIRAERRDDKRDRGHREFHYGAFTRTVTLPVGTNLEGVTANYVDGSCGCPWTRQSPPR